MCLGVYPDRPWFIGPSHMSIFDNPVGIYERSDRKTTYVLNVVTLYPLR